MNKSILSMMSLSGLLIGSLFSVAALAEEKTLAEGVYTQEQAEAGEPLYEQNCSVCHEKSFYEDTLTSWDGDPVLWLFEEVRASMPGDRPGALMSEEYQNILAYVFSINGFPAGETPMDYNTNMQDIIVVAPE